MRFSCIFDHSTVITVVKDFLKNNSYKINLLPKLLSCAVLLLQTRLRLSNHRLLQKNYFILQNNNLTITSKQWLLQNNHDLQATAEYWAICIFSSLKRSSGLNVIIAKCFFIVGMIVWRRLMNLHNLWQIVLGQRLVWRQQHLLLFLQRFHLWQLSYELVKLVLIIQDILQC